ncbi:MAG: hypothetical protein HY682_00420, partial [Chloroflexi bacterium]|nr:hypothetical protein [Chloroflexota bacterium]
LIARALAMTEPGTLQAGYLLSHHGFIVGCDNGDYQGAEEALEKALRIARTHRDVALELWTLARAGHVGMHHLRFEECIDKNGVALTLNRQVNDSVAEIWCRYCIVSTLAAEGNLKEAESATDSMLGFSQQARDRLSTTWALTQRARLSCLTGDWKAAIEAADEGLALAPRDSRLLVAGVIPRFQAGHPKEAEPLLDSLLDIAKRTRAVPGAVPALLGATVAIPLARSIDGRSEGIEQAWQAGRTVLACSRSPFEEAEARTGLAVTAVLRGDVDEAREHYERLSSQGGHMLAWATISGGRLLGLLARTTGKPDDAATHFQQAIAFCRRAGYRPELAWTCHDYADMQVSGKPALDRQSVKALLDEGEQIALELGMVPLVTKFASLRERLAASRGGRAEYPDGLSEREVEVLRLIAGGKTNQEIATTLVISANTVARHIANIFAKTGVSNRGEAGAYAARNGLLR